jgi:CDP-6-deoxy-D-xylo-4-hexulose-3-dehydrase
MEINAVLGLSQIKRLDVNNQQRIDNFNRFMSLIEPYDGLSKDFSIEGACAYCMIFLCETAQMRVDLESHLSQNGVETRPLCSGNLLNQPFLKNYEIDIPWSSNIQMLDKNGFFIGNNHMITDDEFDRLEDLLKSFFGE